MFDTKYSINSLTVGAILGLIEAGTIAIPEIQRPFVWKRSKVRDLIDSMYNGYPTGYIIRWQSPNVRIKNGGESAGKFLLIDGQQRITALMTSILGIKIIDEDYQERVIKIAFNPMAKDDEERFAVLRWRYYYRGIIIPRKDSPGDYRLGIIKDGVERRPYLDRA